MNPKVNIKQKVKSKKEPKGKSKKEPNIKSKKEPKVKPKKEPMAKPKKEKVKPKKEKVKLKQTEGTEGKVIVELEKKKEPDEQVYGDKLKSLLFKIKNQNNYNDNGIRFAWKN